MITLAPNLTQAHSFLTALDEGEDAWLFQTFDDKGTRDKRLIKKMRGSLDSHAASLAELNDRGAGVFVTVNKTAGIGRKKPDITQVRALFVDLDGAPLEPLLSAPVSPHIVTQTSPGRFHAYWRVSDCPVDQCESALKQLIGRYDADKSCSDRSRVLRLPGFYHRKQDPYLVNIYESNPGECRVADLGIDLDLQKSRKEQKSSSESSESSVPSVGDVIARYLPEQPGQRNLLLFDLARHLKGIMPNATENELREIVARWHKLALPVIGTVEFGVTWGDFRRGWAAVKTPFGSVLNRILEEIDVNEKIPASLLSLGYGPNGYRLARICKQLQRNAGENPFFLSARQAGELIGCHFTDASKHLYGLVADGVLKLDKLGVGKQASRYRYVWPE